MSKKLKFAIVGTGSRGIGCFGEMLKLRSDAEIVALCDSNPVRSRAAAEILGIDCRFYDSIDALLKAETLDAVVITTPDFTHEACAVAALKGGVNVLLDKPLATTVKGCRNIIAAAEQSGKCVMIGFNLRYHQVLLKLKEIISSGVLGRVFLIENREFYNGGRTYMARWNRHYNECGGLWIHKGSHDFDVFQWLLDFPKPVRVSAFADVSVLKASELPFKTRPGVEPGPSCGKCPYADECPDVAVFKGNKMWDEKAQAVDGYVKDRCMYLSDKDVHDNGIAMVEYDNGARASHMECFITSVDDRRYTVVGDRGQAEVSLTDRTIVVRPRWSTDVIRYEIGEATGGHGGADPGLLEAFCKVARGEADNHSTTAHGMWSTAVGEAAELSRREHRMVEISELFAK